MRLRFQADRPVETLSAIHHDGFLFSKSGAKFTLFELYIYTSSIDAGNTWRSLNCFLSVNEMWQILSGRFHCVHVRALAFVQEALAGHRLFFIQECDAHL